jgi:hypothetical protein
MSAYHDHYLRCATRADTDAAIAAAGLTDALRDGLAWLDHVGPVGDDTRHHANLRTAAPLSVEQVATLPIIEPPFTPSRAWA